jgi:hypothetical protein
MIQLEREQLIVDKRVQGALLWRVVVGWMLTGLIVTTTIYLAWPTSPQSTSGAASTGVAIGELPLAPLLWGWTTAGLLLPLLLWNMARLSNRISGPICCLHASLRHWVSGQNVEAVQIRRQDFWCETIQQYNELQSQYKPQGRSTAASATSTVSGIGPSDETWEVRAEDLRSEDALAEARCR